MNSNERSANPNSELGPQETPVGLSSESPKKMQGKSIDSETAKIEQDAVDSRRKWPGALWIWTWSLWLICALVTNLAAGPIEDQWPVIDKAVRNIVLFLSLMGIPFSILFWFCFFSDLSSRWIRQSVFWGYGTLQAILLVIMLNYVEYDGNLSPIGLKGESEFNNEVAAGEVDLKTETTDDFPQFLGPNRDGVLSEKHFATNWEIKKPRQIWKQAIGAGHSAFSTRNAHAVTMEQRGEFELTTCYEINSGKLIWKYATENRHSSLFGKLGPRSTPTIFDGMVYSLGAKGHLAGLDGASGKPIWTRNLLAEFGTSIVEEKQAVTWGRSASPLVFDDKVIVPAGGPSGGPFVSLVCYHRMTGEELWRGGEDQISYSSPILITMVDENGNPTRQVVSVCEAYAISFDPETGERLWSVKRPGTSSADANTSQPVVLSDQGLLFTKGYGLGAQRCQIVGDRVEDSKKGWKNTAVLKTKFTNAVSTRGYAFALSDGRLECIDVENGKRIWKSRKDYGHGHILLCGDDLLVLSEKGELVLIPVWDAGRQKVVRKPTPRGKLQAIQGTTWNTIAVHGDFVLVRNSKEAACYQIPLRSAE